MLVEKLVFKNEQLDIKGAALLSKEDATSFVKKFVDDWFKAASSGTNNT